ncbi:outer membrane beta-barrel protein [Fulvivirgaceae bacterium PWU4]|uniref:Outer membrane beta-barrel protein n=1 Tax=Chryseosolibacter histidini TaxID=2782349 RepID=A0AAP2GLE6_9BACT|nr:DUF6089 family protein [Chryseosolibacter histidini]MBT1700044.1 outer membrane beta-barrel protein [Chryseosolibacter histidini]
MKFFPGALLLIATLVSGELLAQRSEIGFGIGTFNYTGDLARTYSFANSKPAGTVFYRSNVSKVVSFRAALTAGKIGASDKRPIDAFAQQRNASFNIFLMEASLAMEYHFLNWRETKHILRYSPYLFGGMALFGMSGNGNKTAEYSNVQGAIPFGAGIKYIVNPKWYLALEFGARKTFFDYLDNVSVGKQSRKNYQYGNPFDNDAYYFLGISVTRTFYDIPCPTNPYK